MEKLLELANDNVEARPYSERGGCFTAPKRSGPSSRDTTRTERWWTPAQTEFEEHDDEVIVRGSIRVVRADGSFAETQVAGTTTSTEPGSIRSAGSPGPASFQLSSQAEPGTSRGV